MVTTVEDGGPAGGAGPSGPRGLYIHQRWFPFILAVKPLGAALSPRARATTRAASEGPGVSCTFGLSLLPPSLQSSGLAALSPYMQPPRLATLMVQLRLGGEKLVVEDFVFGARLCEPILPRCWCVGV